MKHFNEKICIVAHNAYGAMAGGKEGHIGGVERQTSIMCRWLAARGHQVALITWDEGQGKDVMIDGVRVLGLCRRDEGIPGLRFLHPRWTSLVRAMRRADAALYYQNCAEYVTGQVALWCRAAGSAFVYSVASDPDCDPMLPCMKTVRERVLYRYGLRRADRVIVQTQRQKQMLLEGYALTSTVLPMPCPGPSETEYRQLPPPDPDECNVAWVGRIHRQKRPEVLLELAAALPEVFFHVAGKVDSDDERDIAFVEQVAQIKNIILHGAVSRESMPEFYSRASMLCSTSALEGFPNTFIEAWSHGLPVVSLVDPDSLISSNDLGIHAGDTRDLINGIKLLKDNRDVWLRMSRNARAHYLQNYTLDKAMSRFEALFMEVMRSRRA